ncbi:MAG: hypothetical protein ACLFUT_09100 [Desulfobacteraceae bacterium]
MLYMGYFSFDGYTEKPVHGYFSCVVEADDVDNAMDRFRSLLEQTRKDSQTLKEAETVYLDVVIELKQVPAGGFLAHKISREGGLETAISTALPAVDNDVAQAFTMADEGKELEPFMSF